MPKRQKPEPSAPRVQRQPRDLLADALGHYERAAFKLHGDIYAAVKRLAELDAVIATTRQLVEDREGWSL